MGKCWGAVIVCAALCATLSAAPAEAAFPGQNGKIAYASPEDGDHEIFVMNQDGTGPAQLTHNTASDSHPAWSPDGQKIAFASQRDETDPECDINGDRICNTEIYVMNADGTGQARLTTNPVEDHLPTWEPDGTKITFQRTSVCGADGCATSLRKIQPDGSGETFQPGAGPWTPSSPAWAPNGQRLINLSYDYDLWTGALYTSNPDGTGDLFFCCTQGGNPPPGSPDWSPDGSAVTFYFNSQVARQNVSGGPFTALAAGRQPAWSPDGSKIVFVSDRPEGNGIYVMSADGANQAFLRSGSSPDWQPIPINAYPRPVGAYPMRVSLVPAYEPCSAPNRTHGPPLGFGSCNPPTQEPGQLTLGTPDANGQGAKSVGSLRMTTLTGDPATSADEADVRVSANVTDVRMRSDLSDYTGDLQARIAIQITDKNNTPHPGGPGAATVQEFTQSLQVPCAGTANTSVGSTCQLDTTIEALLPGAVVEKRRAIWELGAIRVHDGAGNAFLTQGLFVP